MNSTGGRKQQKECVNPGELRGFIWERNPLRRNRPGVVLSSDELDRLEWYFHHGKITANAVGDLIATCRELMK